MHSSSPGGPPPKNQSTAATGNSGPLAGPPKGTPYAGLFMPDTAVSQAKAQAAAPRTDHGAPASQLQTAAQPSHAAYTGLTAGERQTQPERVGHISAAATAQSAQRAAEHPGDFAPSKAGVAAPPDAKPATHASAASAVPKPGAATAGDLQARAPATSQAPAVAGAAAASAVPKPEAKAATAGNLQAGAQTKVPAPSANTASSGAAIHPKNAMPTLAAQADPKRAPQASGERVGSLPGTQQKDAGKPSNPSGQANATQQNKEAGKSSNPTGQTDATQQQKKDKPTVHVPADAGNVCALPRKRKHFAMRSDMRKNGLRQLNKWVFPALFAMFGFYSQSVCLHYATYSYVQRMMKLTTAEREQPRFARIPDPFEASFGKQMIVTLPILDAVAAFFPFLFLVCCLIQHARTLQVWTKVTVCAGFLFIIKGMLGAMTTVPDSSGWDVCQARLQVAGLAWMQHPGRTFGEMLSLDLNWVMEHHSPLRYCSDMMYSGHTFVVTLFALGSYEALRIALENNSQANSMYARFRDCAFRHLQSKVRHTAEGWDEKKKKAEFDQRFGTAFKSVLLTALAVLAISEQCVEIYFVLRSHFHYSMDVFMSLIITFLFYTNSAIAIFAKQWEFQGFYVFTPSKPPFTPSKPMNQEETMDRFRTKEMWVSKGDVYIPVCCFPFCFMSGRGHVYSDDGLESILEQGFISENYIADLKAKVPPKDLPPRPSTIQDCKLLAELGEKLENVKDDINLSEGVSLEDLKQLTCWRNPDGTESVIMRAGATKRCNDSIKQPLLA